MAAMNGLLNNIPVSDAKCNNFAPISLLIAGKFGGVWEIERLPQTLLDEVGAGC